MRRPSRKVLLRRAGSAALVIAWVMFSTEARDAREGTTLWVVASVVGVVFTMVGVGVLLAALVHVLRCREPAHAHRTTLHGEHLHGLLVARARKRLIREQWEQAQWDARPHIYLDAQGNRVAGPPATDT